MKLNIAFDLDCCLIDFMNGLEITLNEQNVTIVPNDNYKIVTDPQITRKQLMEIFRRTYRLHKRTPFFNGAIELCEKLHAKSQQPILIVTSRQTWCAHWTHQLVEKNLKVPYIICFADKKFGKIQYLDNIKYFVEDRRQTIMELNRYGKKVFYPNYCYNKLPRQNGIWRIESVKQLIPYIDRFVTE